MVTTVQEQRDVFDDNATQRGTGLQPVLLLSQVRDKYRSSPACRNKKKALGHKHKFFCTRACSPHIHTSPPYSYNRIQGIASLLIEEAVYQLIVLFALRARRTSGDLISAHIKRLTSTMLASQRPLPPVRAFIVVAAYVLHSLIVLFYTNASNGSLSEETGVSQ